MADGTRKDFRITFGEKDVSGMDDLFRVPRKVGKL